MTDLLKLQNEILADGKIDASEVAQIKRAIYEDGKIDTNEADFLFELNNKCSKNPNDSSWVDFFVEAISSYLLEDQESPGTIDKKEADWLLEKIESDGKLDSTEKALLKELSSRAKSMPENLKAFIKQNA